MPKRLQEILEDIGLNRREARIYLAALFRPESSLAEISRATLIPRMSCYTILRNLLQKGFVDVLIMKKRRYFVAVPPQKILDRLKRRAGEFQEAIPRFERHAQAHPPLPRVRFFEGIEGIRAVFRYILNEKRPFCAITCIDDMKQIAEPYFMEFIDQRIKQNLKIRLLTNRSPSSIQLKTRDGQEMRETRFLPPGYRFHTAEYIFGNKVAILSLTQTPPTTTILEDPEIAATHKMHFDLLWEMVSTS